SLGLGDRLRALQPRHVSGVGLQLGLELGVLGDVRILLGDFSPRLPAPLGPVLLQLLVALLQLLVALLSLRVALLQLGELLLLLVREAARGLLLLELLMARLRFLGFLGEVLALLLELLALLGAFLALLLA